MSAFLIGFVLVHFEDEIGVPRSTLYFLAGLPVVFLVYDVICYFNERIPVAKMLRGIAIMNLLYCGISIGFLIYHWETISWWGWVYFEVEILVVGVLARVEMGFDDRI